MNRDIGLSEAETLSWGVLKALHPEDRDRYPEQRQQAVSKGQPYEIAYRLLGADGSYHWFVEQAIPMLGENGKVQDWRVSCTPQAQREVQLEQTERERTAQLEAANHLKDELSVRELTARAHAETAQQRFRELVDGLVDAIVWEADAQGRQLTFISQSAEHILGYPVEQWLTPDFWVKLIHPDDRAWAVNCREETRQGQHEFEYRCIAADGQVIWFRDRVYGVRDELGNIQKLRGLMIDITKSKQAEEVLRESEVRFRSMADTAPVMIWLSGTDALCNWFNKPWLEFTGRTLEQELGNGWAESVYPDDLQCCLDTYMSAFNARQSFKMEYRLRRSDGEYCWLLNNGVPRFTPGGEFAGYIGSCIDITDRKASEEALKARADELTYLTAVLAQTNVALEKRNQELDQFAYVASHDLKAPLRAIANLSEWIEEDLADRKSVV